MLRAVASSVGRCGVMMAVRPTVSTAAAPLITIQKRNSGHGPVESPEEFDQRFVDFFNQADLDGWDLRRGLTELQTYDVVPEPKIVSAALRACRRVNDYALAVRFLEGLRFKCGSNIDTVYAYILKECKPVLDELGISTPEQMGYDKPEFFQPQPDEWWEHKWYKEYGYEKKHGYEF